MVGMRQTFYMTGVAWEGAAQTWVYVAVMILLILALPPVSHAVVDRPDSWVGGVPFLYFSLLVIYVLLIGVLAWALHKDV